MVRRAIFALLGVLTPLAAEAAVPARALVVTVTKGFRHPSIPTAEGVLMGISQQTKWFTVTFVRDDAELAAAMSPDALQQLDLVMFVNTTGDLPLPDRPAFLRWIENGGAFIGVHAAADTLHGDDGYLSMLGGEFDFHGSDASSPLVFVEGASHPATGFLSDTFTPVDEIYRFKRFDPAVVHTLLAMHSDPDSGAPGFYPLSWWRSYGKGRVFYTAFGHRSDVWESVWFQQHLIGAIAWAIAADQRTPRRRAVR